MAAQLRLDLERAPSYERDAFVQSPSNALAVAALDAWPAWRDGALVLVGPAGSGKTHLATAWAMRSGASPLNVDSDLADLASIAGPVLIEDADRRPHGEVLFHLINRAAQTGAGLLTTARTAPSQWSAQVPDLRSRLNALPVVELSAPDDMVLYGVLEKFFKQRNIRPSEELLAYLIKRIERSVTSAEAVVAKLDETAAAQGRPVSRSLAREVLDRSDQSLEDLS